MSNSNRGFFRNAFDAMVAARERQAKQYIANMTKLYGGFPGFEDTPRSGADKRGPRG